MNGPHMSSLGLHQHGSSPQVISLHSNTTRLRDLNQSPSQLNQIFALPQPVLLTPLHSELLPPHAPPKVPGTMAQDYQLHLRKTMLRQTKHRLRARERQNSFKEQKKVHATIAISNGRQRRSQSLKQAVDRTAYDTLKVLQRVIIKQNYLKEPRKFIEIKANKLPIIKKQGPKRQRSVPQYDPKYKWEPTQPCPQNKESKLIELRGRGGASRPELSGWEFQDFDMY